MRLTSNVVVLSALAIYATLSLPVVEQVLVVVLGVLLASLMTMTRVQEFGLQLLGIASRRLYALVQSRQTTVLSREAALFCASIDEYPRYMKTVLNRKKSLFFMLSKAEQRQAVAVQNYMRIKDVEASVKLNFDALQALKAYTMETYHLKPLDLHGLQARPYDVVEIIEHLTRDWSNSGHHGNARAELLRPLWPRLTGKQRVLIPGSGLGRFAADLAEKLGPDAIVDAPELSFPMYATSAFAVSRPSKLELKLYPYLLQSSYLRKGSDQLASAAVELPKAPNSYNKINFACENFLKFDKGYKYDAVATLFFIDTAQNVFEYIKRIAAVLAPGGIWVNYGPLKWGTAAFVEFSLDELIAYLKTSGWVIEETWSGTNRYNGSEESMLNTRYEIAGWVARRPAA